MTVRETTQEIERATLSPFAMHSDESRGRQCPIDDDDFRTAFQRDRDRVLHCKAFRRLKQKTQVFLSPEGDLYRTRLTHTLEVAQIARTISRALRLNEDLTEAIALGHDLGHTPFGHAGERALDALTPGGFTHNQQSLRVVDHLEREGKGLNLTWEVRNGIVTHTKDPWPATREGAVVRHSDRIAYVNHDIEDAMRAGILQESDLPAEAVAVLGHTKSARISTMIRSMVEHGVEEIAAMEPEAQAILELRNYMYATVCVDEQGKFEERKVGKFIAELYEWFITHPDELPPLYATIAYKEGIDRAVTDYISGMSDEFAIRTFNDIFVPKRWHVL